MQAPSRGAALALTLLAACAPVGESQRVASASGVPEISTYLNRARAEQGLPAVAPSPALTGAAVAQARYTASTGRVTHRSPGGGNAKDRVEARGYDACMTAENLAARQPDAASVSAGWLASPGHRNNMLRPEATHYGAGVAVTEDGTRYWTLVLARRC